MKNKRHTFMWLIILVAVLVLMFKLFLVLDNNTVEKKFATKDSSNNSTATMKQIFGDKPEREIITYNQIQKMNNRE